MFSRDIELLLLLIILLFCLDIVSYNSESHQYSKYLPGVHNTIRSVTFSVCPFGKVSLVY